MVRCYVGFILDLSTLHNAMEPHNTYSVMKVLWLGNAVSFYIQCGVERNPYCGDIAGLMVPRSRGTSQTEGVAVPAHLTTWRTEHV